MWFKMWKKIIIWTLVIVRYLNCLSYSSQHTNVIWLNWRAAKKKARKNELKWFKDNHRPAEVLVLLIKPIQISVASKSSISMKCTWLQFHLMSCHHHWNCIETLKNVSLTSAFIVFTSSQFLFLLWEYLISSIMYYYRTPSYGPFWEHVCIFSTAYARTKLVFIEKKIKQF